MKTKDTLQNLIESKKFDWINRNITSENFPEEDCRSSEYRLFHFNRYISSEDAVKKMKKEGYSAANIYELLTWNEWNKWNKNYFVVALGSSCEVIGDRYVPMLGRDDDGRGLGLDWWGFDWDGGCRFLAVRTVSLENEKSSSEALGDFDTLRNSIENLPATLILTIGGRQEELIMKSEVLALITAKSMRKHLYYILASIVVILYIFIAVMAVKGVSTL